MRSRWMLWAAGLGFLLLAGAATAVFLTNRREVTTSSSAAYKLYKEAVENDNRFYFKEARVGYAKALQLDPHFAMAILGLARQSGDMEQASALIRRAAREEPRLTERERLRIDLELAYVDRHPEQALKIAQRLHEKFPDDPRSVSVLCHELIQNGHAEEAVKIYEDLLAIDPNNAEAYNQIGYNYGWRGDYDKAMEYLKKYQFIAPDTANPFDSLGENQAYAGHYTEAIENLNRALAIKPDFSPAYEHLGVVYEGMGDGAKAIESYRKAIELAESDGLRGKYLTEGLRAAFRARDMAAVAEFRGWFAKLPKSPYTDLRAALIDAFVSLVSGQAAQADARVTELLPKVEAKWVEIEGKSAHEKFHRPEFNWVLAKAKEAQGKTDDAARLYGINANPPNAFSDFEGRRWVIESRASLAVILAKKGNLDAAEKLIAENRKWNPSWAPTREAETTVAELRRAKVLAAAR
ncbi:MAG: tetratricopeptide repeat protein [Acidobacteriota bacterium]